MDINLNLCLNKLIAKGFAAIPPEGVEMPDYETLIATSQITGYTAPTIDLLISVWVEVLLDQAKDIKIGYFSNLSFQLRQELIPDYKLINASLGVYSEQERDSIVAIVGSFRNEFYRLKGLVLQAENIAEVEAITDQFTR